MDRLDTLLLEAWNRISAKVRADRVQALKRSQRRFKGEAAAIHAPPAQGGKPAAN